MTEVHYNSLDTYQNELLRYFNVDYSGLVIAIEAVYSKVKEEDTVKSLIAKIRRTTVSLDEDTAFIILFDYTCFMKTCAFLKALSDNEPTTDTFNDLYDTIQ